MSREAVVRRFSGKRGQMAVELAVVMPVVLAVLVIAVDCMVFVNECARFDHLAAQAVLAQGCSSGEGKYEDSARAADVETQLKEGFSSHGSHVEVAVESAGGLPIWQKKIFACSLHMAPWPLASGGTTLFGIKVPSLFSHTLRIAVDPYTPGKLI